MAKLENNLKNMFLSLTAISLVVGALLGGVFALTEEPIKKADADKLAKALKAVAPEFDNEVVAVPAQSENGEEAMVYDLTKGGAPVGKAIQVITKKGFSGNVKLLFGFDTEGNITGYSVLAMSETPGLGAKMPQWFAEGGGNVIGKNPGTNKLTVRKDGGEVDAITAATISSRAFCDGIAQAYDVFKQGADATSTATPVEAEEKVSND